MYQITDENFTIVDGKSYTVIWDGETYQCVATTFNGISVLGNLHIMVPKAYDTSEPFLFAMMSVSEKGVYANDTAAAHIITVRWEVAYPIAPEFLPEGYPYKKKDKILPETVVQIETANEAVNNPFIVNFTAGSLYKVIWDGIAYEVIAANIKGATAIGNAALANVGDDTGEPFFIASVGGNTILFTETAGSHSISIIGETIHPIATEFLPTYIATKSEVEAAKTTAETAQSTAETAQSTAETAQSTAETAQSKANEAVKYTTSQNLTDKQKQNARTNIGAGTSNFSGNYNDLANKPILLSVPTQSDIGTTKIDILDYIITSDKVEIYSTQHIFDTSSSIFTNLPKTVIYGYDDSGRITIYNSALDSTWRLIDSINVKVNNTVYYGVGIGAYIGTLNESYFFISNNGFIVVSKDRLKTKNSIKYFTIELNNISLTMPIVYLSERFIPSSIQRVGDDLIISSSTAESTKKFKITVDDSGTLSAVQV